MRLNLRTLPKLRDGLSYAYVEKCQIEQDMLSVAAEDEENHDHLPAASLGVLMLGPGTSITHAAIKNLADCGCLVMWTGEGMTRFYAMGIGETRKGNHLELQAKLWADAATHGQVVERMYRMRFGRRLPMDLTIEQIRGMEGARVRDAYARASRETGVPWSGRSYDRTDWKSGDAVNRALSAANACLYSICHTAIVSGGYTPGLGFVHTGKALSFVYDIGDLYKVEVTVPVAFEIAKKNPAYLESAVRKRCRERFYEVRLLDRILPDIDRLFDLGQDLPLPEFDVDDDPARPTAYWDPPKEEGADDGRDDS